MIIIPMTVEQALEYAPKAALLDFGGPVTPDFIAALREHLSYAISALAAVSSKLYEAEAAILDLHESNVELAELLRAKSKPFKSEIINRGPQGGIDPEYGTQMAFDDVPSRDPIEIIDEAARESNRAFARRQEENLLAGMRSTVEFRTDPGTYDANRGEIHRMLAEEIVATFGDKSAANPSEGGTETSELPLERGTQTDSE